MLVISNRLYTLHFDFEIAIVITPWFVLHLVQLLLCIILFIESCLKR